MLLINSSEINISLPSLPWPRADTVIKHEKLEAFGCLLSEEHYFLIFLNEPVMNWIPKFLQTKMIETKVI